MSDRTISDLATRDPTIVIGGFGAAGAAMALALRLGGVPQAEIAVFEAGPEGGSAPAGPDTRILALNAGSRAFLTALGAWERLEADAYPMRSIAISDTALDEEIRPRLLDMDAPPDGAPLAHLVPLGQLSSVLRALCHEQGISPVHGRYLGSEADAEGITIRLAGQTLRARLLVGADGARSPVRVAAGISSHGWEYAQTAIVATIRHAFDHHGEAIQHFLPSGPFAMLPLSEGRSSIVWSETTEGAQAFLASDSEAQRDAIAARAAGWRGDILAIEALSSHPLRLSLARRHVADRIALVADAAHVVHPLAGQGLNLGFEDCASLAERIVERLRLGLDPGAPDMLEAYQAHRRPAAVAMAYATEGLNRLFSNDSAPLRLLRDVGAGLIDRIPGVKRRLMAAASGQVRQVPRLFRGEAI